jgi:hypothetical protein
MKTAIGFYLLFFLFTLFSRVFGQANIYHPFSLDGGEWRADYFSSYCAGLCEQRRYYTSGDTIIDSLKYKKLYGDIVPEAGNSFYGQYFGALREDTATRRIFFWALFSPEERILFDYDLDSGDVAPETYLHSEDDTMIVISIDSILIGTNFHKRFNLSTTTGYPAALIEGVGWSGGLILEKMSPLIGWEEIYNLKCFKVNSILEYEDTSYVFPACDLPLNLDELNLSEQSSILTPNPVLIGSNLYFNLKERQKYKCRIFDITGNMLVQMSLTDNGFYISPAIFKEGVYFLELSDSISIRFLTKLVLLKSN